MQAKVNHGIVEAASKWKIDLDGRDSFFFENNGHFHGNKLLRDRSVATYKGHYRGG
jgi:hypothetical protein